MKKFFKKLGKSPKTTATGVVTLTAIGFAAYQNPSILASPQTLASIAAGLGLLFAPDQKQ